MLLLVTLSVGQPAHAEEALVAVASNFAAVLSDIEEQFAEKTDHSIRIVAGSTGKLYTQIANGAPFDVLLAADQQRPSRLVDEGLAVKGSRFTYATGRLVFWQPVSQDIDATAELASRIGDLRSIAIANPALAPYGAAAQQTLESLQQWQQPATKIVMGENIGQAFAMVATGSAEAGLVALAQLSNPHIGTAGYVEEIPANLHEPISQDAVVLLHGRSNRAALEFMRYLQSDDAMRLIQSSGYQAATAGD